VTKIPAKASLVIGDAEYLKALSGAKQRGAIREWCRKNGIRTFDNTSGWAGYHRGGP
jgi:hypothetical protein